MAECPTCKEYLAPSDRYNFCMYCGESLLLVDGEFQVKPRDQSGEDDQDAQIDPPASQLGENFMDRGADAIE